MENPPRELGLWHELLRTLAANPISTFAVLCVAATASYLGYLTHRMLDVLESHSWCSRAVQAERITPSDTFQGLTTCNELLKIQLEAVGTGFYISVSTYSLALLVLVVVVIAGARATFKVSDKGLEGDISRDPSAAAKHVVAGAKDAADEVEEGQ